MNKQKIIDVVVAEEFLIEGLLADFDIKRYGHVGRCVIGALLFAAGIGDEILKDECGLRGLSTGGNDYYKLMKDEYEMTFDDINRLMGFNDAAGFSSQGRSCSMLNPFNNAEEEDRARVCAVVKFIEEDV